MASEKIDVLGNLLDKRIILFNKRRDYEWKVFFTVIASLGALDAFIISNNFRIEGPLFCIWITIVLLIVSAAFYFELQLQKRNKGDRDVIDEIQKELCDSIKLAEANKIRKPIEHPSSKIHGLWAFWPKCMILLAITVISANLPLLIKHHRYTDTRTEKCPSHTHVKQKTTNQSLHTNGDSAVAPFP